MTGPARRPRRVRALIAVLVMVSGSAVTSDVGAQPESETQQTQRLRFRDLVEARREADATIWKDEVEAQRYEQTFVALADDLRAAHDALAVLKSFQFAVIVMGRPGRHWPVVPGILTADLAAEPRTLDRIRWKSFVAGIREAGFHIVQSEWQHVNFLRDGVGPPRSTFSIGINATNADRTAWYDITGPLEVVWSDGKDERGNFIPETIDATGLRVRWRTGPSFFDQRGLGAVTFPAEYGGINARDLDGDGLSEIICPPDNTLFWNRGGGVFERDRLCAQPVGVVIEGLLADFTGDGRVDLLVAGSNPRPGRAPTRFGLFLYAGNETGRFDKLPTLVIDSATITLRHPNGMTAGDIDADGDLDLFVPQYLPPYIGGQFPTPYYDANDGFDAYLLHNDGSGRFTDGTEAARLETKRRRRSFGSSFVDLDEDGDLDLLVVSGFGGTDLYANDGTGQFADVTSAMVDAASSFGTGHTFGDFNADGFLDFFVAGMDSPTVRRLDAMGLGRDDHPEHDLKRTEIGYGNRMYVRLAPGRFEQPGFRDSVARTGWSWGCVNLDFDNDGDTDLYVANGNQSGATGQDYATTFWRHDIYSGSSQQDPVQSRVYLQEARSCFSGSVSWHGFEHNRLLMSRHGWDFTNVAFLMNAALEADCRGVLADDLDGDGRMDLVVDARAGRGDRERELRLLLNRNPQPNNWIGVRLTGAPGVSPLGARVTLDHGKGRRAAVITSGDSYGAQHAPVAHFGLGPRTRINFIEVRWPNGAISRLTRPAINTWHDVKN
ncbi:MAG: CRTAC1 family protein [Planctomycetota bacterium]